MDTKTKKRAYKITKIVWFIIGGFLFFFTLFLFIRVQASNSLGVIAGALLLALGIFALIIFIGITLLFLLIKWIVKKWKKKK